MLVGFGGVLGVGKLCGYGAGRLVVFDLAEGRGAVDNHAEIFECVVSRR